MPSRTSTALLFWPLILSTCASLEHIPGISEYESLNYTPITRSSPIRSKRDAGNKFDGLDDYPVSVDLIAFGRILSIVLYRDPLLFSRDFTVIVGGLQMPDQRTQAIRNTVRGYLRNYTDSYVFGTLIDGIFRGTIATSKSLLSIEDRPFHSTNFDGDEVFYVEPYGNFLTAYPGFHSLIYRATSVTSEPLKLGTLRRSRRSSFRAEEPWFCGLSDPKIAERLRELSGETEAVRLPRSSIYVNPFSNAGQQAYQKLPSRNHFSPNISLNFQMHSSETPTPASGSQYDGGPTSRVCNLYLQSDTFLWNHVIGLPHIHGKKDLAVKEIASIFTQHVQGAQAIYQFATFKDFTGRTVFHGVSFRVDRVLINVTDEDCRRVPFRSYEFFDRSFGTDSLPPIPSALPKTVQPPPQNYNLPILERGSYSIHNPFCAENVDVTNFLNLNSYVNHNDFCLAYVFTYRDFSGGTLGLAWVAEPGGSGGVCEKHRLMREGSLTVKKSLNTGVVTLLNYGNRVSVKISQLTFAHEMGHNLGAKHDDDFKDDVPSCLPSVDDPKGNYIMFASATGGDKENNNKFSSCSSSSIAALISQVVKSESNCFLTSNGSFCGNRLTEEGEQCDCGFTQDECDDICCHPKESATPCSLAKHVAASNRTLKVHYSPTAGECCTLFCQYRNRTHLCLGADECHMSSYCLGTSAQCPPPVNLPDGTPCKNFTQICKRGECLGSICERIPGWQTCSLPRGKNISPEMMCYVACRENKTGAPCISTFELETNSSLRQAYPHLVSELLRSDKGLRLQPGSPCDNYLGYCDVFLRCQSVVAEGPLARLRNLLFSPQMLKKVQTWITVHWWAMLLIVFCAVTLMIVFMKLCSYRTPSSYSRHPLPHPHGRYMVRIQMESRDNLSQEPEMPSSRRGFISKKPQRGPKRNSERGSDRFFDRKSPPYLVNRSQLISISLDDGHCSEAPQTCYVVSGRPNSRDLPFPYQRHKKQNYRRYNQSSSTRPASMALGEYDIPNRHSKERPTSFILYESSDNNRPACLLPVECLVPPISGPQSKSAIRN